MTASVEQPDLAMYLLNDRLYLKTHQVVGKDQVYLFVPADKASTKKQNGFNCD